VDVTSQSEGRVSDNCGRLVVIIVHDCEELWINEANKFEPHL
jgi:hypothetical protein